MIEWGYEYKTASTGCGNHLFHTCNILAVRNLDSARTRFLRSQFSSYLNYLVGAEADELSYALLRSSLPKCHAFQGKKKLPVNIVAVQDIVHKVL